MAKQVRYAVLTLTNGETKMIQVKTTTDEYIRKVIKDLRLSVKKWEIL